MRETLQEQWRTMRDIRLAGLRDAPDAFASSYQREAAYGEAEWRGWITSAGMFLAYLPEASVAEPAGLVGGYRPTPGITELIAMYVLPQARGRGVGEALVGTVIGWARARNAASVHLWVTEANKPARLLYERCGFSLTGERQPLPSDPGLTEVGMTYPL